MGESLTLLKGGADTGFRRVLPEAYEPRLFHVEKQEGQKKRSITIVQKPLKKGNLESEDVFILDTGKKIYQWNGSTCSNDEKFKAAQECTKIKSNRNGKVEVETLEEKSIAAEHPFYAHLKDGKSKEKGPAAEPACKVFRVSDADGSLDMEEVTSPTRDSLKPEDVFIIVTKDHCFTWIGGGASIDERKNGLAYASNYLNKTETPFLPISVVAQGKESEDFNSINWNLF